MQRYNYFTIWQNKNTIIINGIPYTATTVSQGGATFTTTGTKPTPTYYAFYGDNLESFNENGATLKSSFAYDNDNNAANLPMYATGSGKTLTFSNICAVLEIKMLVAGDKIVLSANENIAGPFSVVNNKAELAAIGDCLSNTIKVTGTFTANQLVYVAIPAGTYNSFQITLYNGTSPVNNPTAKTVTFAVNKVYPVTINITQSKFLNGVFSVIDDKTVTFTKGNLYWDGGAFHIEANQAACSTTYNANHVGHFYFAQTAAAACGQNTPSSTSYLFCDGYVDNSINRTLTVDNESGLYVLSTYEWFYLLRRRDDADDLRHVGNNYLLIAPDDYTGPTLSTITTASAATAAGVVYLPFAGYRYSNNIYGSVSGYLSLTKSYSSYYYIDPSDGYTYESGGNYAYAIRLMKDVE